MSDVEAPGLAGLRVAIFETRLSQELANLVRKHGGEPLVGPTMVEAPLSLGPEVRAFVTALTENKIDAVLVLTGVGNRKLVQLVSELVSREQFRDLLQGVVVAARGPKAVLALRELGVKPQVVAPDPHTWLDLLAALEAHMDLRGKRVAIQQYGVPHEKLSQALVERGAEVVEVPVYRWQLPEDLSPLTRVIEAICANTVQVVLFTSGPQAGSLVEVAQRLGREAELRAALRGCVVGSVGPSCTEALRNLELEPDFEPAHSKMGHLVLEAARRAPALLAKKRS
jgi:uroporphyrinogen-III synthase